MTFRCANLSSLRMLQRILLPVILSILAGGFWLSPDFGEVAAGVAIFLFGMLSLERGFGAFTGGTLERLLGQATDGRWRSLAFGLVGTALMQSSSLVSLLAISFLGAGLIPLVGGIGIVFGANLGTTTGAWLIAGFGLKVALDAWAMPVLVFGIVLLFRRSPRLEGPGHVLVGIGFLFLGIHHVKEGFDAFRDTIDLARFAVDGYPGIFLFVAVGVLATVVMQSSHATLILTISALATDQVTYENALALAIGANVGTTITAGLGALGSDAGGRRLAAAHLIFNLSTGLVAIALLRALAALVERLAAWAGIAADDFTLKLALFHTLFNLIGVVLLFPLIEPLAAWLERALPDREPSVDRPRYLSAAAAEFPTTAVEAVRNETLRVYAAATRVVAAGLGIERPGGGAAGVGDAADAWAGERGVRDVDVLYARHVKPLYSAIVAFIGETAFGRREEGAARLQWLREANVRIVEALKDAKHLQKNLARHANSPNADVRRAYADLRDQVADVIDSLRTLEHDAGGAIDMLSLDALKLAVDEHREDTVERITRLVGRHRISPEIGSSLLNDSAYAHAISLNLLRAAQTLFAVREPELSSAARRVQLDESELDALRERTNAPGGVRVGAEANRSPP